MINIQSELSRFLRELPQPVITDYELYQHIYRLYIDKKSHGSKFPFRNVSRQNFSNNFVNPLIMTSIISEHKNFPEGRVYQLVGNKPDDVADVVCSVDPFSYVSHLSAMEYHGLTNRLPKILFISTPDPKSWKKYASEKMMRDLGDMSVDYIQYNLPILVRISFSSVNNTKINRYASLHRGAFKHVEGRKLRVSTIGRTFLDMLREPTYCGGMRHIMDVYKEHGERYRRLIIDEVDRHGNAIEKVRAGYLLEKLCDISDPKIEAWIKCVQRGGSRKLDPNNPYRETYDERWWISLNVE